MILAKGIVFQMAIYAPEETSHSRYLENHSNGSFRHPHNSGNICDALDTGLNEKGSKEMN